MSDYSPSHTSVGQIIGHMTDSLHALYHPQAAGAIECLYGQLKDGLMQLRGGDEITPAWTMHLRQAVCSLKGSNSP